MRRYSLKEFYQAARDRSGLIPGDNVVGDIGLDLRDQSSFKHPSLV